MSFKPNLASPADFAILRYPVLASRKLDGIRATVHVDKDGRATFMSRSMKPLPNAYLQRELRRTGDELIGFDGELIVGPPNVSDTFRTTTSHVMSEESTGFRFTYHAFDLFDFPGTYLSRYAVLKNRLWAPNPPSWARLDIPAKITDQAALDIYEQQALDDGYEGVMVRDPRGLYKQGRSTAKEQGLLKVKRHEDCEALVIGWEERQHNGNEAYTNELGRTARSSHQANKVGLGTLGTLLVRGLPDTPYANVEFAVGTGFNDQDRSSLWALRDRLPGKIVRVKYFPLGSKDKPRHPVFSGFRDVRDL